jgi:hypothetical protein
MPRNTGFHDGGGHALPFVINGQAKAAGGIMDVDVNDAISMLQRIAQGFASNLNDLFGNTRSHWEFRSLDVVLNSSPPLFRKWSHRHRKRLVYVLLRKRCGTQSSERSPAMRQC